MGVGPAGGLVAVGVSVRVGVKANVFVGMMVLVGINVPVGNFISTKSRRVWELVEEIERESSGM